VKIPDVNVWLAAAWARHSRHTAARDWLDAEAGELGFCRVTQMSFLRLLTNPAITREEALTRRQAWDVYAKLIADPRIRLIREPDNVEALWMTFSKRDDKSHLLWTDDYVAAFVQAVEAELVTLDRGFKKRYPPIRVTCLI
jgi:toxin-antitoxin system PIN domain toxin